MKKLAFLAFLCLGFMACDNDTGTLCELTATVSETDWALTVISETDAQQVIRFVEDGEYLYYFLANCCDHYDPVYDCEGNYICSPTGSIAGTGDGLCPEMDVSNEAVLIWTP